MFEKKAIDPSYLPDAIAESHLITQAHLAKIGFVNFTLSDAFQDRFTTRNEERFIKTREYLDELYSLLEKSPHIMQIRPSREELLHELEGRKLALITWRAGSFSISRFLSLRVVLPQRKRDELKFFPWTQCPEEFELFFNGTLFAAIAKVDEIPNAEALGHISREFLIETLAPSMILDRKSGIGPTPIHPKFYFLHVAENTTVSAPLTQKPIFHVAHGNLVVVVPDSQPLAAIISSLLRDMLLPLSDFYMQRIAEQRYREAIDALEELDKQLNTQVAVYFKQNSIQQPFTGKSRAIRQLIAEMHIALRKMSHCEKLARMKEEEARCSIAEAVFLKYLGTYFDEHMASSTIFDREAELNSMNFAATETNNFAVVQATVVAAFIGAIIGGAFLLFLQNNESKAPAPQKEIKAIKGN